MQLQGSLVMKGVGRGKDEPGESREHAGGRACLPDLGTLPPLDLIIGKTDIINN